jgi:signal transduction histidine kinase
MSPDPGVVPVVSSSTDVTRAQETEDDVTRGIPVHRAVGAAADAIDLDSAAFGRAVLESLAAHVCVIDPNGVIIATNRAWDDFARANGVPQQSDRRPFIGSNYLDACGRDAQSDAVAAGIRDVIAGRAPEFTLEYPCHSPTEKRWFLLQVSPLTLEGRGIGGAVISHVNITQRTEHEEAIRRHAEEMTRLAEELKRSNDELDQFAYVTSHDLKAPLRGIANLSRWIEEDMGERFTPEAHQQMNLLRGRVHRMEALIDGLLAYSRIGRAATKTEPVDVRRLLREVVDLIAPPSGFVVEVGQNMPMLRGSRLALQQVFMNLIGNAIKHHGGPSGHIAVTVVDAGQGFYEFRVSDDGQGIDPKYHERIFAIFQTLEARDKVEGTGIGLALVKKTVERAGGRVRVESAGPGRGATFAFTWPKVPSQPAAETEGEK